MHLPRFAAISAAASLPSSYNKTVFIPSQLTYSLPSSYVGNVTSDFVSTTTGNQTLDSLLAEAAQSVFIAYDKEFYDLVGEGTTVQLVSENATESFFELAAWDYDHNAVWFASGPPPRQVGRIDLESGNITFPATSLPIAFPNGGIYYQGKVYVCDFGNGTAAGDLPPAIYAVDATTFETTVVVNSFFGSRFNGPDDVVWVTPQGSEKTYLYFTDPNFGTSIFANGIQNIPNGVWRFDPSDQSLIQVISKTEIPVPNGIRTNKDQTALYVTGTAGVAIGAGYGIGLNSTGTPSIYKFDLTSDGWPVNKRQIGLARNGWPDGIHIDDSDRVWTCEEEGIVVRSPSGKVLGLFNAKVLNGDPELPMANFALAGDKLVVLANTKLWFIQLKQKVVSPRSV